MTCPHLEHTSAVFDGAANDDGHTCDECRAFLADASALRERMSRHRDSSFEPARRKGRAWLLVPAAAVVATVIAVVTFRTSRPEEQGPFAGLDPGKRAVIYVKGRP